MPGIVTPPGNNLTTIFQVGTYASLTDTFTTVVDLNNGNPFSIHNSGLQMPQPTKTEIKSANVRTPGEIVTKVQYLNRHIVVQVWLRQSAGTAALMASMRQLIAAIEHPPYTLRIAPPLGTLYTYADVVHVTHTIPSDAQVILAKAINHIEIDFECKPGLRGDRVYLQNLVANPGFDAPSAPGVVVFNDPLANLQSYASTAGAAPTQTPAQTYVDIVMPDAPVRYFRLGEASGGSAYDISGGINTAAVYQGSPTLGATGAISGDTDTAATFNGSSSYVYTPNAASLPVGSAAFTLECWLKIIAYPVTTTAMALSIGNATAHNGAYIGIQTGGKLECGTYSGVQATSNAAVATGGYHHVVLVYSGGTNGTLTIYLDGVAQTSVPTETAALSYGSLALAIGAMSGSAASRWLNATVDEACVYAAALSSTRITAHYNAGHSGASGTVSNALALAAGAQVSFGSPAWSSLQTWQIRFRWVSGLTARFYLHYVDANDWLKVEVTANGLALIQNVAGVQTTVISSTPVMTHEAWYWLQITQFPTPAAIGWPIQVTLSYDAAGTIANILGAGQLLPNGVGTLAAAASGTGQPRIEASGAQLVVGGPFSNVHEVALFGPGSWYTSQGGGAYAISSGAWDQNPADNYPGGPITSYGSGRVDCAPSGEISYYWQSADGSTSARVQQTAIPTSPMTMYGFAVVVHSVGVSNTCNQIVTASEYDGGGHFLRASTIVGTNSVAGAQVGWTQLSGTITTGASTAYIILLLRVQDTTAGASANGTVWWDNVQWWNITQTGQTTMPYCELRFVQSPALIVASGVAGDMPAPATMEIGVYLTSLAVGQTANIIAGRRAMVGAGMRLLQASTGFNPTLDATSYGGFNCPGANLGLVPYPATDEQGTYHVYGRAQSANAAHIGAVYIQPDVFTLQVPVGQSPTIADTSLAHWRGAQVTPFAAANTWQVVDVGPVTLPVYAPGSLSDLTQIAGDTSTTSGTTGSGNGAAQLTSNWIALMPDDAETLNALVTNAAGAAGPITNEWLYLYADGVTGATTYSLEAGAVPNPAHGGGSGGVGIDTPAVQQIGSEVMYLDPTITTPGGAAAGSPGANGVNQICLIAVDSAANALPVAVDIVYSPLYLWLR